jgi:hypothetical protein
MKKTLLILLLLLFLIQITQAQMSLYSSSYDTLRQIDYQGYVPDPTLVNQFNPRKSLLIPIAESIGLNLALSAFNAYVMDSEFAKISFETIKENYEEGWSTDADALLTNMFAHPFHGSIYFNTARSSGYNYWTSWGVAMIGSWQWEFHMENEPPALNDWIMTSMAGSMIGEIFYRMGNLILDESLSGSARTWNEIGAGIFNPGRLFNRLIYGRTARTTTEKLYEKRPALGELGFGINNVADGTDFKNGQRNGMFTIDFAYGALFNKRGSFKPFDFFRWNLALNFGIGKSEQEKQPLIGQFRIYSILAGKATRYEDGSAFLWGFFNNYDYLENNVYQLGNVSIGPGVGYRTPEKKSIQYIGVIDAGLSPMGAANSVYADSFDVAFLDSARNYNMGPGAHIRMENIVRWSWGSFYLGYSFWWIHTWDGAPGNEYIGMWSPKLRIRLYDRWYIGLEYLLYHRIGKYDDYEDLSSQNNEQRLFIGYSF